MRVGPLITIIVGALLLSCHTTKSARHANEPIGIDPLLYDQEHVLVLLLDFTANEAMIRSARLIEGTFEPLQEELASEDFVSIQYLDADEKVLFEKIIDHPLLYYSEYADDKGTIHLAQRTKEKGSILVRSQHLTSVRLIRIGYGKKKNYRHLTTIPLETS